MKIKIIFKPLRNLTAKPVKIIHKKVRTIVRPAKTLKRVIGRGLRIHLGPGETFRAMLHRRATAPFRFTLPGLAEAGKA